MAGTYHIRADQQATFARTLTWKDSTGTPVNLTGYTARMQIRYSIGAVVVLELSTSNARITLGGAAGTISLLVTATEMAALESGTYHYDLVLTSGTTVTVLLAGYFVVESGITV